MQTKMDEMVAVVPANFVDVAFPSVFTPYKRALHAALLDKVAFKRRGDMEEDPTWRQLIAYVSLYNSQGEILAYRRTKSGGENRLWSMISVGFGGHVNEGDMEGAPQDPLLVAAYRELSEELKFKPELVAPCVCSGYIVTDESPVDRVHMGVVYSVFSGRSEATARDAECEVLGWRTSEDFHEDRLEDWSEIVLRQRKV